MTQSTPGREARSAPSSPVAAAAARSGALLLVAALLLVVGSGCSAARPAPGSAAGPAGAGAEVAEPGSPSADERRLASLIDQYRAAHHLAPLPLSRSLSKVARLHARDLSAHGFGGACSIHSWSSAGPWTPCCYEMARPEPKCMWNKPRELTPYESVGFEIAYWYSAGVRPAAALETWKTSPLHNSVILNLDKWKGWDWRAMGVGIDGDYAVVWVGQAPDPAGAWN